MEARESEVRDKPWEEIPNEFPASHSENSKRKPSVSQKRRIFVANGFWWYEDSYARAKIMLDPIFNQSGWKIGRLAKMLGVGEKTLSRTVELSLGIQGKTWLRLVRIVSIRYVLTGDLKIENVASDFGFSQHSDFTREFKDLVGITPSEFLRRRRKLLDSRWA